tara:strand:+ start:1736 stop:2245 length:510 start_codon:yes stop_codon:yes gene_type:complete
MIGPYIPKAANTYQGKQVLINSDRLVFNAKNDSILLYSDKAIGFSTNGSFHFDTTNIQKNKFVVNAPNIYLGLVNNESLPEEPAVLGDELGEFLGGDIGVLELFNDMIDVICDSLQYQCPAAGKGKLTTGNWQNEGMFSQIRARVKFLKDDAMAKPGISSIKSDTTKIA